MKNPLYIALVLGLLLTACTRSAAPPPPALNNAYSLAYAQQGQAPQVPGVQYSLALKGSPQQHRLQLGLTLVNTSSKPIAVNFAELALAQTNGMRSTAVPLDLPQSAAQGSTFTLNPNDTLRTVCAAAPTYSRKLYALTGLNGPLQNAYSLDLAFLQTPTGTPLVQAQSVQFALPTQAYQTYWQQYTQQNALAYWQPAMPLDSFNQATAQWLEQSLAPAMAATPQQVNDSTPPRPQSFFATWRQQELNINGVAIRLRGYQHNDSTFINLRLSNNSVFNMVIQPQNLGPVGWPQATSQQQDAAAAFIKVPRGQRFIQNFVMEGRLEGRLKGRLQSRLQGSSGEGPAGSSGEGPAVGPAGRTPGKQQQDTTQRLVQFDFSGLRVAKTNTPLLPRPLVWRLVPWQPETQSP